MTFIHKISLFQFRNYEQSTYDIASGITCICGQNGTGKTNLLDAIYTLCYTKSYFSGTIGPTIMNGKDAYRLEGIFGQNGKKEQVVCKLKNGKKEIICNNISYNKQSEHIGKYAAVMIAPDDINLINDSSEQRRKFMDGILGQCDPLYLDYLIQYQKVIQQRNAWLKMYATGATADFSLLDYYDALLVEPARYIHTARNNFVENFTPLLQHYYKILSGDREEINVQYQSDLAQAPISFWLKEHTAQDLRYQRSLRGIHRDELFFLINHHPLKTQGSQGQKKSYLFALKMAQFQFVKTQKNFSPILLLDDVFEKLDQNRMESLLQLIHEPTFGQVILTDTHEKRVRATFGDRGSLSFIQL